MNEVSSFEKELDLFWLVKKLVCQNTKSILQYIVKIGFLEIKNLDLCLLYKIKSFDSKNIISKKKWFVNDQICFVIIKKKNGFLMIEKLDLFFYIYFKNMEMIV